MRPDDKTSLTIYCSKAFKQTVQDFSDERGLSLSDTIRMAFKELFAKEDRRKKKVDKRYKEVGAEPDIIPSC